MELARKVVNHYNNVEEATVRSTAKVCKISKTTVHRILREVLPNEKSLKKLERNRLEAPMRGGIATAAAKAKAQKYKGKSSEIENSKTKVQT